MLEKNKSTDNVSQISFDWERIKKKATSSKEKLIGNSPNVIKRPPVNTIAASPTNEVPSQNSATHSRAYNSTPTTDMTIESPIDQLSNTSIDIFKQGTQQDSGTHTPLLLNNGTQSSQLLAAAAAQGGSTLLPDCGDESLGPDRNAVDLLKALKVGDTTGKELTIDERRLVVKSMKELGQTQDAIADLLKVSRRTIVNDYKVLRQEQALAIAKTDTHEIAGEVYTTAKTCIRRALAAGSFKTVSVIMRDMVELLQSLGILYRAPKTSMQATGHFDIPGRNKGYQKYMNGIGEDKTKVVEVLDCMFSAIDNNELSDHS